MNWGEEAQARLSQIAACSTTVDGVSRLPFSREHQAALEYIRGWMERAGLEPELSPSGTFIGRSTGGRGPSLILGSHQDSVPQGGRYDGIMGVLLPCLALEKMQREGRRPAAPIEVMAFADEEGVRFPTALIGPRALAGTLDPAVLDLRDAEGQSIAQAMRAFGGDPERLPSLRRDPKDVRGYIEVHIEQGPVLEQAGLALGTVTGICGIERNAVVFTGETGHAGTMPMAGRRDALVAAARFISGVNSLALDWDHDVRATVGTLSLAPGAVNAIPKRVAVVLELRAIDDEQRNSMHAAARRLAQQSAETMGCGLSFERTYAQEAVLCDPGLQGRVSEALEATQGQSMSLPSGATHDASAMSDLCPVAMMFVRCRAGVSHRPDEFVSEADLEAAVTALTYVLEGL